MAAGSTRPLRRSEPLVTFLIPLVTIGAFGCNDAGWHAVLWALTTK